MIKMATAMALSLTAESPLWQVACAAALAWFGVQSHLSGLFVAAPLLAALAFTRRIKGVAVVAAAVIALQIPFLISLLRDPSAGAGPTSLVAGVANPQVFRPWVAYGSVTGITGNLLIHLYDWYEYTIPTLIAATIVAYVYRKDLIVIAVSAGAVLTATVLFTTSTRAYDGYWFVTLTPAMTIAFGMAIAAIPSKNAVKWIGFAMLAAIALMQPARIEDSTRYFKYPQYGTMVKASRELIMRAPVVRDIKLTFEVHPTMDRFFVYKILGGQIAPSAVNIAVFNSDGSVTLQ